MFTGIIEGVGVIKSIEHFKNHTRISIQTPFSLRGTQLGESIAVDGCCLTVTRRQNKSFFADVSPETLERSTLGAFKTGRRVNLERPLRLMDRLGGHLVQGHVDGVGKLVSKRLVTSASAPYYIMEVQVPKHLQTAMVEKGSVAVDGISLTVNRAAGSKISLCIIPHTQGRTTLTEKEIGDKVNLEADILLKYLEKMLKKDVNRSTKRRRS
jgi:riboflavin synthase, alpha subunit